MKNNGHGYGRKFPVCDEILDSMEKHFSPSTSRHWIGKIGKRRKEKRSLLSSVVPSARIEMSSGIEELVKDKDGKELLELVVQHFSLEQRMLGLLQAMKVRSELQGRQKE